MSEFILFWFLAVLTIVSAIFAVSLRNPINCAMGFIVSLAAVAGIFWLLDARVISILQILIYAGAIVTLLVFVIMLLNVPDEMLPREQRVLYWIGGMLVVAGCIQAVTLPASVSTGKPDVLTYEAASLTDTNAPLQLAIQHLPRDQRVARERKVFGSMRQISSRIFGEPTVDSKTDKAAKFGPYLLAFEILSLLLLVAVVGAVILTKRKI